MPDDHSELEPPLPIPNRTVKRFRADDSAATSVKVGYRQAIISKSPNRTVKRFRADDSAATSVKVGYRQAIISKSP